MPNRSAPAARRRASPAIGAVAIVVLLLVVVGGYGEHWRWIGVNGDTATLWDWLHLVVLPLLVPAVIVPLLRPVVSERFSDAEGR